MCFDAMMAAGDDETFNNHKLHLCPTFSRECGIAFSIFQRAFSVVLSAIQETGDEYDLNKTRMGPDAGGDVQIAEAAANNTPVLPFPPAARVLHNRRNKLLFKHIYTATRTCRTRTSATTSSRCSTATAAPLGCGLFRSATCPSLTSRWPATLEANWLNLSFSSVGLIMANTIF